MPEKYRPLAQKALDLMSGKLKGGSESALQSEIINENIFPIVRESFELFESGTTIENQLYGVDRFEHKLDQEMFLIAQNIVQENEPYKVSDSEESEAIIAEEYLDSEESEFIESEIITNGESKR